MDELKKRLRALNATLAPIKAFTKVALGHPEPQEVVDSWRDEFDARLSKGSSLLPLLYVANDVVQEGKQRNALQLVTSLGASLGPALEEALEADVSLFSRVTRMIDVWEERKVFDAEFLADVKSRVGMRAGKPTSTEPRTGNLEDDDGEEEEHHASPMDVVKRRLDEIDLHQLVAYLDALSDPTTPPSDARTAQEMDDLLDRADSTFDVAELASVVRTRLAAFDAERVRVALFNDVVRDVVVHKLERLAERAETDLEHATVELETCEALGEALDLMDAEGVYSTTVTRNKLMLKRKAMEDEKKETPMIYDKRLKKYVPLPSFDNEASWRDT